MAKTRNAAQSRMLSQPPDHPYPMGSATPASFSVQNARSAGE